MYPLLQRPSVVIRFLLILTFVHKLFTITMPPLEVAHNWRQTTVAMVARNFIETGADILQPKVDMAGDLTGITGMEFPALNYLIYLVSLIFGYDHWYGRLINLMVSYAGLWCFYDYLKNYIGTKRSLVTVMTIMFSLFYYYSRKIMPDTFSMGLVMMGCWSFYKWADNRSLLGLIAGFTFVLLGLLSKLPSVVITAFLIPLVFNTKLTRSIPVIISLSIAAIAAGWWYFYWVPHLENQYGFHHFFMGQSVGWTVQFLAHHWPDTLHIIYAKALGYSGFALFIAGCLFLRGTTRWEWWTLGTGLLLFAVFVLKSGDKFINHEYYILPMIPWMAMVVSNITNKISAQLLWPFLFVFCFEGIARKWDDQFIKTAPEIAYLEKEIEPYVLPYQKIVINSGEYPTPLYFANRKGWLANNDSLLNSAFVDNLRSMGCSHIVVLKKRFGSMVELPYQKTYESDLIALYVI